MVSPTASRCTLGLVGTITEVQIDLLQHKLGNLAQAVASLQSLKTIAGDLGAIGDIVNVAEAAGAYGFGSCAFTLRFAQSALSKFGITGMALAFALDMTVTLGASARDGELAWLRGLQAVARTGCTRIEWFNNSEPRVSSVLTFPPGKSQEVNGDRFPENDSRQRWTIRCGNST